MSDGLPHAFGILFPVILSLYHIHYLSATFRLLVRWSARIGGGGCCPTPLYM
jgi:hypothetical protein